MLLQLWEDLQAQWVVIGVDLLLHMVVAVVLVEEIAVRTPMDMVGRLLRMGEGVETEEIGMGLAEDVTGIVVRLLLLEVIMIASDADLAVAVPTVDMVAVDAGDIETCKTNVQHV